MQWQYLWVIVKAGEVDRLREDIGTAAVPSPRDPATREVREGGVLV